MDTRPQDEILSRADTLSSVTDDDQDGQHESPAKPQVAKPASHKRATSGSLLSRLLFSRSTEHSIATSPQDELASPPGIDDEDNAFPMFDQVAVDDEASRAHVIKQRKRKGSLRKVALLGGRRFGSEMRERRNSLLQRNAAKATSPTEPMPQDNEASDVDKHDSIGQRLDSTETGNSAATPPSSTETTEAPAVTAARLSLLTAQTGDDAAQRQQNGRQSQDASTILSSPTDPRSSNSYASTTEDDDEGLSFSRPSTSGVSIVSSEATYPPPMPAANATSYFPAPAKSLRTRSQNRVRPSPLQHALAPVPEPYSYAETEYWGWVILFVTWVSFTVGMGSCLDIWSWAWDVGETPYAPPELEDDPTLPIVGYYPALIVLTGVVAWVWITVAWTGMKYFRHAKIEV